MSAKNLFMIKKPKNYKNLESTDLIKNIYSSESGDLISGLTKASPKRKYLHSKQNSLVTLPTKKSEK